MAAGLVFLIVGALLWVAALVVWVVSDLNPEESEHGAEDAAERYRGIE